MWIGAAGEGRVDRYQGVPPDPATRADVQRVVGLYGGVRHAFDENLTVASPWLAAGGVEGRPKLSRSPPLRIRVTPPRQMLRHDCAATNSARPCAPWPNADAFAHESP